MRDDKSTAKLVINAGLQGRSAFLLVQEGGALEPGDGITQ